MIPHGCFATSPFITLHAFVQRALPGAAVYGSAMTGPFPPKPAHQFSPMRFAPLALIALASAVLLLFRIDKIMSLEHLLRSQDVLMHYVAAHFIAAVIIFIFLYAAAVALSLPGATLLTVAGGFLFGGWLGGGLSVLAASAGAVALFLAARSSLATVFSARADPWLARFRDGFARDAASYMLFLRLTPVFPFWLVNLASALTGVPLTTFVWTTLLGILPGTFVFAFAGAGLESVARAQEAAAAACAAQAATPCPSGFAFSSLVTHDTMLALAGLALLALLPVAVKRWRAIAAPPSL